MANAEAARACCRPQPQWYGAVSGFLVFLGDTTYTHSNPAYDAAGPDFQTFKIGFGGSGAIGYKLTRSIRTEFEVAFRTSDVDTDAATLTTGQTGSNTRRTLAFMVNGYYDYHNQTALTPYIGAGIGEAYVKSSRTYQDTGTGEMTAAQKGWALAYQFMAGVNYETEVGVTPIDLTLGYRYFTGADVETDKAISTAPSKFKFNNDSHNLELGGKIYF